MSQPIHDHHYDFEAWPLAELEEAVERLQREVASRRREAARRLRTRDAARAGAEGISIEELHDRDASRSLRELLLLAGRIDRT